MFVSEAMLVIELRKVEEEMIGVKRLREREKDERGIDR